MGGDGWVVGVGWDGWRGVGGSRGWSVGGDGETLGLVFPKNRENAGKPK